jgi:hypothetical protein
MAFSEQQTFWNHMNLKYKRSNHGRYEEILFGLHLLPIHDMLQTSSHTIHLLF